VPGWKTLARSESKATLRIVFVTNIDLSDIGTSTFFGRPMWELDGWEGWVGPDL